MVLLEFISSNLIAEALQLTELQTGLVLSCVQIPFPAFLLWSQESNQQMAQHKRKGSDKEAVAKEHHGKKNK